MRTLCILFAVVSYVIAEQVLYDQKHHRAVIVRPGEGCYEYHMNHEELTQSQNTASRPALEAKMIAALNCSPTKTEVGHHSIDHLGQDIKTACRDVPVYGFDQDATCAGSSMAPSMASSMATDMSSGMSTMPPVMTT
uniref:Uncharacterized protein LOC111110511 n=1 Tax=Crassostrea virginica TaxID=6565 RepID=A0A8B8BIH2_CRAVI|nr:uncharacterized protein LOC111110511 [Crassostrea virginica]